VIILLRHGRTAANAAGLLLGRADPDLDEEGVRQAAALAEAVRSSTCRVTQVVSSPLGRCRQTAERVASAIGASVSVDERWIEMDYGDLDGIPTADVPAETWAAWSSDLTWTPPGGESMAALGARVRGACDELDNDRDVVVVTHVSPIKAAVAWALGVGDEVAWRMFVAPASITRIAVSGKRRSLHSFNEVVHLE
jgi:broad specificity phosphatase PhoE